MTTRGDTVFEVTATAITRHTRGTGLEVADTLLLLSAGSYTAYDRDTARAGIERAVTAHYSAHGIVLTSDHGGREFTLDTTTGKLRLTAPDTLILAYLRRVR